MYKRLFQLAIITTFSISTASADSLAHPEDGGDGWGYTDHNEDYIPLYGDQYESGDTDYVDGFGDLLACGLGDTSGDSKGSSGGSYALEEPICCTTTNEYVEGRMPQDRDGNPINEFETEEWNPRVPTMDERNEPDPNDRHYTPQVVSVDAVLYMFGIHPPSLCHGPCPQGKVCAPKNLINKSGDGVHFNNPSRPTGFEPPNDHAMQYEVVVVDSSRTPKFKAKNCGCRTLTPPTEAKKALRPIQRRTSQTPEAEPANPPGDLENPDFTGGPRVL